MENIANCKLHILLLVDKITSCLSAVFAFTIITHACLTVYSAYVYAASKYNIMNLMVRLKPVTSCLQMVQECTIKT